MSNGTPQFAPEYRCLDDLMRDVLQRLLDGNADRFEASKGFGTELVGINLRLSNPRARLSRSEMRGKVFSALGELFWYLSGSDKLDFIQHYIPIYKEASDDGDTVHGAYGPRIFGEGHAGTAQIQNVISLLKSKPTSRRAAIQIFSADDLLKDYADIPCTCTLQAMVRNEKLNLIVYMRSNDAYWGLPHDVFAFTMLQELIARAIGVEVGFYQHMVGNLHLYDGKRQEAHDYLSEKFQTIEPMPPMPSDDPWPLLPALRKAEQAVRSDPTANVESTFGPYWGDIIRLLRVHSENRHKKQGYERRITEIKSQMCYGTYDLYFP